MKTLEQLEAEEAQLWKELKAVELPYRAKAEQWCIVKNELDRARVRAELLKEMEAGK